MDAQNSLIVTNADTLALAGRIANQHAAANLFDDYRQRIAAQTLRRQDTDLALFSRYLRSANLFVCDLASRPECWRGMTWGIVSGFVQWQLQEGYAVGSINVRLATIKRYCELAYQAGVITVEDHMLIKTVKGYGHKQAKKVDEKRDQVRVGDKKAAATGLTKEQADLLKQHPDTPVGRRDALLMCLLLDHGLRCGEIARLQVSAFDLKAGTFTFHRPKVDKDQTHRMTADTIRAAAAYLNFDAPAVGPVIRSSRNGQLLGPMGERAINDRVGTLGRAIGVTGLSPHDCRHYWATRAARKGTDPFALQEAGGWNSLAMPRRYVEAARIANEGVVL